MLGLNYSWSVSRAWLVAALVLSQAGIRASASAATGNPAPPLVVRDLDGRPFDLAAARGKVVVVNFWATWCPPCRAEMPMLSAFYQQHHGEGLEMIGVSEDQSREKGDVRKLRKSVAYPIAMASDAKANGFGEHTLLPVTVVVDSAGLVCAVFTSDKSALTAKMLTDAVVPLLPHPSASPTQP